MTKFFLTSAIPYVNAAPHIGHAQEFVYSDVIRRYRKILGEDVLYLCGADENALKIFQAAEKAKQTPKAFSDLHNGEFLELAKKLNVHFDVWQRGTDEVHHYPSSQKMWQLCWENGDIYKKAYTGLYCVGCEQFYTEDELDEKGECFEHPGRKLDRVSEENYFFRLSKYKDFLEDLIKKDKLKIVPAIRKNEALAFIQKGLEDFSISRSRERARGWGIPVPQDQEQILYVWLDALNIYQTGIGFTWDEENYKKWWPQDLMVIGKGIIRFHAVYWPAILKSAGLLLPKALFVHGYLTVNGQKMSKSLGNVIDPVALVDTYGTDALRYFLLREVPSTADGDFSERRFKEIYNADLANGLGNLVARVAKLCESADFTIMGSKDRVSGHIVDVGEYSEALENYRFNDALSLVVGKIAQEDKFIDEEKPWKLLKSPSQAGAVRLRETLSHLVDGLQEIAAMLEPFLPETAKKIEEQFKGPKIISQKPLFPRL
jgi:methionyl-tRNA synthetase